MSKFVQDLKINIKSKTWWITVISALIIICKAFGYDLTKLIGNGWENTLTLIFSLLATLGLNLNLSESDNNVNQTSQTENISTVNGSASINVVNPNSVPIIGNEVNNTTSNIPK